MSPNKERRRQELQDRICELEQRLDDAKQREEKYGRSYCSSDRFDWLDQFIMGAFIGGIIGAIPMILFPTAYWLAVIGAVIGAILFVNKNISARDSHRFASLEVERISGELRALHTELNNL